MKLPLNWPGDGGPCWRVHADWPGRAEAGVTRLEIRVARAVRRRADLRRHPARMSASPGGSTVKLDPRDKLNAEIVDLDKAPRNSRGSGRIPRPIFFILKPVDMATGSGAPCFYDCEQPRPTRRGAHSIQRRARRANDPRAAEDAGNGFLMRYGFTVVWSGWLPDLPDTNNNLRLQVPSAGRSEGPGLGRISVQRQDDDCRPSFHSGWRVRGTPTC